MYHYQYLMVYWEVHKKGLNESVFLSAHSQSFVRFIWTQIRSSETTLTDGFVPAFKPVSKTRLKP